MWKFAVLFLGAVILSVAIIGTEETTKTLLLGLVWALFARIFWRIAGDD